MRIGIGIPVYVNLINHCDFLNQTTKSIKTSHEWIFIPIINRYTIDKQGWQFTQQPSEVIELEGRQPQSVSKAWNDIIGKAIEERCEYIVILNQDVVLARSAIDNFVAYAEKNKSTNLMWAMEESKRLDTLNTYVGEPLGLKSSFSAFMVDRNFSGVFGRFDENIIPAYFEDNDTYARIVKLKKHMIQCKDARFFHYGSVILKTDPNYQNSHHITFKKNRDYFVKKWGHDPVWTEEEVFRLYYRTPFNDPENDINSW